MSIVQDTRTVVTLDLDETLIHSQSIGNGNIMVHIRGGTIPLLEYCFLNPVWIRVVFWTLGTKSYATNILKILGGTCRVPMTYDLMTPDDGYVGPKSIARVASFLGVDPNFIIAVDDNLTNYAGDDNVFRVTPYDMSMILLRTPDHDLFNFLLMLKMLIPYQPGPVYQVTQSESSETTETSFTTSEDSSIEP